MNTTITKAAGLLIAMLLLCGCQQSPERGAVVSKNDGAFDARAVQSATGPVEADVEALPGEQYTYKADFSSTDGSVAFTIDLEAELPAEPLPVVEVAPHYLTGQEARRAAQVLFDGASFYEAQPSFATVYSKPEIQEKLVRWSQYASDEALAQLFGTPQPNAAAVVQDFILRYTRLLETAPETVAATPCLWQFQPSWKYSYTEAQVQAEGISISTDDELRACTRVDGIPYCFTAMTRNRADYKYNTLFALPDYGLSPWSLDEMLLQAALCRDKKPTDAQLRHARDTAQSWLNRMALGEWAVDSCDVLRQANGDAVDYKIRVQAVPVFHGAAAIRRPQLNDLKSEGQYASNYYLTDAELVFSPEGTLLSFHLHSPVDVTRVVSECPAVLDMDRLMERARTYFQLTDMYFYGIGGTMDESGADIRCQVAVDTLEYGLSRVKVPDSDERYYYVPSVALSGDVQYTIAGTGEVCFSNPDTMLLLLNAVDGSVIPLENGSGRGPAD